MRTAIAAADGPGPEEYREWLERGFAPERAREWMADGASLEEAEAWRDVGAGVAATALAYRVRGITPLEYSVAPRRMRRRMRRGNWRGIRS